MLTLRRGGPAGPASPGAVALLLECHARIREFVALARRLAEARDAGPAEVADAAARVARYFGVALPLHALDEEASLAPRLAGLDPAVDAALAAMAREHREHEPPVAALLAACEALAREPGRHAAEAPALAAAAAALEAHFGPHLASEEAVVFPAIERLLDAAAVAEIVEELRARRR